MIVKKINPEWQPTENKELKVGDTVEITDPKSLIINGDVMAVDSDGNEVSAYDLYGVITHNEREDFESYLRTKKQEQVKTALDRQAENLKKQETATEKVTDGEHRTATEAQAENKKKEEEKKEAVKPPAGKKIAEL